MVQISTIGVVGLGQMGSGIAQVSATAGFQTLLWDSSPKSVDNSKRVISSSLQKLVEKEKLTARESAEASSRLKYTDKLQDLGSCDLLVEAIVEDIDIKLKLFRELDGILPRESVLASNTSSISITRLAAGTGRPQQFIGMHFMNPVPLMKLVEIIRGLQTSDETYQCIRQCAEKMGKTTILGVDSAGFVVNRILCPMINEAIFLLQEGVKAEDIDTAMKLGTNQPMGPLTLADFVGLDTLLAILRILHNELGEDKYRPCPLLVKYVEAGWYGKKSGRGFYRYS